VTIKKRAESVCPFGGSGFAKKVELARLRGWYFPPAVLLIFRPEAINLQRATRINQEKKKEDSCIYPFICRRKVTEIRKVMDQPSLQIVQKEIRCVDLYTQTE